MKFKLFAATAALVMAAATAHATTVVIPDPSPNPFIYFGTGNASVVYDGVTFAQQAALSNGNFYNVGFGFSGDPAVLSSQQQTQGVANILITLPNATDAFSLDYGTFDGSSVTFALSNGQNFTEGSTGSGYATPDVFSTSGGGPITWVEVTSSDTTLNINDITFTSVPEAATWAMMLIGLGGLGAGLRLQRRTALAAA